jgi:phosphoribosylformylglycinamidine synthase subunit PurL
VAPGLAFREPGHAIALAGPFRPSLRGSELEKLRGSLAGGLPEVDLAEQARALEAVRAAARSGTLGSAHDISEGGLAGALAECCLAGGIGARVDVPGEGEEALFGEGPGGFVLSGPRAAVEAVEGAVVIGEVGGEAIEIAGAAGSLVVPVEEAFEAYERSIPGHFS